MAFSVFREKFVDDYVPTPFENTPLSAWLISLERAKAEQDDAGFDSKNLVSRSAPVPESSFQPLPYLRALDERPIAQTFAPQRALTEIFEGAPAETNGAGHREPQLAPLSEEAEAVAEPLVEFESLQEIEDPIENQRNHRLRFTAGKLAVNGMAAALGLASRLKSAAQSGKDSVKVMSGRLNSLQEPRIEIGLREKISRLNAKRFSKYVGAAAMAGAAAIGDKVEFLADKSKPAFLEVRDRLEQIERPDKSKAAKIALGGVALIGAAAAAKYGFNLVGGASRTYDQAKDVVSQPVISLPQTVHGSEVLSAGSSLTDQHVKHAHRAVSAVHAAKYHTEQLKYYGDTMWYHVKANVHAKFPNLSPDKLNDLTDKYTQMALKVNHIKDQGRHMFVGEHFKVLNILKRK